MSKSDREKAKILESVDKNEKLEPLGYESTESNKSKVKNNHTKKPKEDDLLRTEKSGRKIYAGKNGEQYYLNAEGGKTYLTDDELKDIKK